MLCQDRGGQCEQRRNSYCDDESGNHMFGMLSFCPLIGGHPAFCSAARMVERTKLSSLAEMRNSCA
jgi:hypothetical protein